MFSEAAVAIGPALLQVQLKSVGNGELFVGATPSIAENRHPILNENSARRIFIRR